MKIILIISLVSVCAFLVKVGYLIYEILGMNFDFNRSWYADTIPLEQPEEPTMTTSADVAWKASDASQYATGSLKCSSFAKNNL